MNTKTNTNLIGGVAFLTTILVWVVQTFGGVEIPAEIGAAITGAAAWILGILVPEDVLAGKS